MDRLDIQVILARILQRTEAPADLPSVEDWDELEQKFSTKFSPDFKNFVELLAQFEFPGDFYNVRRSAVTNGNDHIGAVFDDERASDGSWPEWLIPFYGIGNGDYFGLDARLGPDSPVYYWYHERSVAEPYSESFQSWVLQLESFLAD